MEVGRKMVNVEWLIVYVGTAALIAVVCIIMFQRMLRGKSSGFPLQEERNISQERMPLGFSLIVLGIVFGSHRLIGYSFIGAGVLLSIITEINSRRNEKRSSMETR